MTTSHSDREFVGSLHGQDIHVSWQLIRISIFIANVPTKKGSSADRLSGVTHYCYVTEMTVAWILSEWRLAGGLDPLENRK